MKLVPILLINVLVVGVGLALYDTLRSDPTPLPDMAWEREPAAPAPEGGGLRGSADRMLAHSSETRLRDLEAAVARLQAELERSRNGAGAPAEPGPAAPDAGRIDERTLAWLTAYRDEILKREGDARLRARMAEEFDRKGVALAPEAMAAVVRETQAFHERARALMRTPVAPGETGRQARQQAIRALRAAYAATVEQLVPAEQAERILQSRMGRARDILPAPDND